MYQTAAYAIYSYYLVDESAEVTIEQVARMIADAFGIEQGIVLDTTKSDGQMKKTASNAKLRRYLPDFQRSRMPLKPLSIGLLRTNMMGQSFANKVFHKQS